MKKLVVAVLGIGLCCCACHRKHHKWTEDARTGDTGNVATTVVPVSKIWNVERGCDSDPSLRLTQIVVVGEETQVRMRYTNTSKKSVWIQTAPAGSAAAFSLESGDRTKKVGLKRSEGIAISPERTTVKAGETIEFRAVFDAIDESWGPISIHESEEKKAGETFWAFDKVELK